jgi:hypothetical protein
MTFENFRNVKYLKLDWLGNTCDVRSGAMNTLIESLTPDDERFPILTVSPKVGRLWTAVTCDQLCRLITPPNGKTKNRGLYEILLAHRKRKVYFDVDKTDLDLEEIKKIIVDRFPNARLQISGRPGSYHIVLSNYFAQDLAAMLTTVKLFAIEHREKGFDVRVYGRNQNFKCIYQSKPNSPVQDYIEGSTTASKHFVHHDFDEDAIDIDTIDFGYEMVDSKGKPVKDKTCLDILCVPQQTLTPPKNYDCLHSFPADKLALLPNPVRGKPDMLDPPINWQVMLWCREAGLDFETFWAWCSKKDANVERFRKYQKSWKSDRKYSVNNKFMDLLLERFYPDINVSPAAQRLKEQFHVSDTPHFLTVERSHLDARSICRPAQNKRRLEPVMESVFRPINPKKIFKFTFLISPMGSNKTGAVVDYILKYGSQWRILWLTPRISLTQNTKGRLERANIHAVSYQDFTRLQKVEGALDNAQFVLCSIQSLHYTKKSFDMVVIDEPETMFSTFKGDCMTHHHNLSTNWHTLVGHLTEAKKVVLMDAFTTNMSMNFVKGIIRQHDHRVADHYEVVTTSADPPPRQFREMDSFKTWMTHILKAAQNGDKVYIYTPYKSKAKGVEAIVRTLTDLMGWTEGREIFGYYAEKSAEKQKLQHAEQIWGRSECRCVVTNAAISVGVNFNTRDVFDRIYGFYASFIPVRDFIQALYRVRHPKETTMILLRQRVANLGWEKRFIGTPPDCGIFRRLQKDIKIEMNAYDDVKEWATFNMFCSKANITILPDKETMSIEENEAYLDRIKGMCDVAFCWTYIEDIDRLTAERLMIKTYNSKATLDDRLQLQKFFFKKKFVPETPNVNLSLMWDERSVIDKMIEFKKREIFAKEHPASAKTDMIIELFRHNALTLGDDFPSVMKNPFPRELIEQHFKFGAPVRNMESGVSSQMINAFFGKRMYKLEKRKMENNQRHYEYATTDLYRFVCGRGLPYISVAMAEHEEPRHPMLNDDDEDEEEGSPAPEVDAVDEEESSEGEPTEEQEWESDEIEISQMEREFLKEMRQLGLMF